MSSGRRPVYRQARRRRWAVGAGWTVTRRNRARVAVGVGLASVAARPIGIESCSRLRAGGAYATRSSVVAWRSPAPVSPPVPAGRLVLVLGSSRVAYGVRPGVVPDTPQGPVVVNLALAGSGPVMELMALRRALAAGLRPAANRRRILAGIFAAGWTVPRGGPARPDTAIARRRWPDRRVLPRPRWPPGSPARRDPLALGVGAPQNAPEPDRPALAASGSADPAECGRRSTKQDGYRAGITSIRRTCRGPGRPRKRTTTRCLLGSMSGPDSDRALTQIVAEARAAGARMALGLPA